MYYLATCESHDAFWYDKTMCCYVYIYLDNMDNKTEALFHIPDSHDG